MANCRPFSLKIMQILYSQKIDRDIHDEVNNMGPKLGAIFGFSFPTVQFDEKNISRAQKIAKQATTNDSLDENKAGEILKKIYGVRLPPITVYINTTPFSTWNIDEHYISISIDRFPDQVFSSFCHEANHYLYDTLYGTKKYQDTEIKETITILNTAFGIKDRGWHALEDARQAVWNKYEETRDFAKAIERARVTLAR